RFVVTQQTTIHNLVAFYENRGITNYTGRLQQTSIAIAKPFTDGPLANVYKVNLSHQNYVAVKCVKHNDPYKKLKRGAREMSVWLPQYHENILPILGFAVVEDDLAMVSQWMNNGHVRNYVSQSSQARLDILGFSELNSSGLLSTFTNTE
ncbi:unnamed protein product, partial [Rhizoctonia solani]